MTYVYFWTVQTKTNCTYTTLSLKTKPGEPCRHPVEHSCLIRYGNKPINYKGLQVNTFTILYSYTDSWDCNSQLENFWRLVTHTAFSPTINKLVLNLNIHASVQYLVTERYGRFEQTDKRWLQLTMYYTDILFYFLGTLESTSKIYANIRIKYTITFG